MNKPYSFAGNFPYNNYNQVLKKEFGGRVQKISIHAGLTCPNRDGTKGRGGCTYCNNQSFVPEYCHPTKSITQQVNEGIDFFKRKYENQAYLAYFQSYTNTYDTLENLIQIYEEALSHPKVKGIVIGTRPDCVNDEILKYFAQLSEKYYVMIEYGVETTENSTLSFINRGHDYECSVEAIRKTATLGIKTGAHLILGLPLEAKETILNHARKISELPLTAIKLHQLQLIKGTTMAHQFNAHPEWFRLMSADEYIDLAIDFLELLRPDIAVERFVSQSPSEFLISPDWGLKNFEFVAKIEKRLRERNTWHGRLVNW